MKTPTRLTLLATLALLGLRAEAASISLQPSQATVQQNGNFTVDLLLNATDAPGGHPGLFSGQVVIDFNPALLSFTGFATSLHLFSPVTTGSAGGKQTVTLGFDNAADNGVVGSFSFTAIGSPQQVAAIGLADADDFMGTFVNTVPTNQGFVPTAAGTSIQIQAVPAPGAAWLALTALGAAATRLRRRDARRATPAA